MLVAMLLEDMLGDLGCKSITVATSVETAIDLIADNRFDLATLDVNLNGKRSIAVAEALDRRDIPFAFATGNDEHRFGKRFEDHLVLKKPFRSDRFEEVLRRLVSEGTD